MSLKTLTSRIRKKSLLSLSVLEFVFLVIHAYYLNFINHLSGFKFEQQQQQQKTGIK